MISRVYVKPLLVVASSLLFSSCTWVKLTTEGENVSVLYAEEVSTQGDSCTKVGSTSVSVLDKVGLERAQSKIILELQTLARNNAASRGNVIVATSEINEGDQDFDIFQCD